MQLYRESLDKESNMINVEQVQQRITELAPEPNSVDIK